MKKKPLSEGSTRGQVKNGENKPTTTQGNSVPQQRPTAPPPAPKPKK